MTEALSQTSPKTEYRLSSNGMIQATTLITWAIAGAQTGELDKMVDIVSQSWDIPSSAAKALLSEQVSYTIDADTVVFSA